MKRWVMCFRCLHMYDWNTAQYHGTDKPYTAMDVIRNKQASKEKE